MTPHLALVRIDDAGPVPLGGPARSSLRERSRAKRGYAARGSAAPPAPRVDREFERDQLREFGRRLTHHRIARDVPYATLAARAGLTVERLAAVERGEIADLPYRTVTSLCEALDLRVSDFFGDDVAVPPRTHDVSITPDTYLNIDDATQRFLLVRDTPNYRAGDRMCLCEAIEGEPTGRTLVMEIVYLTTPDPPELAPGCVLLAIEPARDAWTVAPSREG
jgi:transcriptional regulator with XRE-family HTH domain